MTESLYFASQFIFLFITVFLFLFLIYSIKEKEKRAVKRTVPLLLISLAIVFLNIFGFVPFLFQVLVTVLFLAALPVIIIRFGNKPVSYKLPEKKFDERDIMFSRMELDPGTEKFENYYWRKPENRPKDDLFRKEPGLLKSGTKFYDPLMFSAADATFSTVGLLKPLVVSDNIKHKKDIGTTEITAFIKQWALKLGAADVGFTLLQPHHLYSHTGRGKDYGKEIALNHKYAIAFTVEMSHESMSYAPQGPVIMESSQQYMNAGTIAVQIAQFIRNLGFEARAHIDANYKVICPVVAQDAGLGTIGRMGLLLTPKLGARVRIGVITTDLNIEPVKKHIDQTIIRFCEICKKCAVNCPAKAISHKPGKTKGVWKPWKINHEKCFTYWCKTGTDCGRCISVCPFSHPDNFIHNIVRWMIKRNPLNRRLALILDDYFYGNKPPVKSLKN